LNGIDMKLGLKSCVLLLLVLPGPASIVAAEIDFVTDVEPILE